MAVLISPRAGTEGSAASISMQNLSGAMLSPMLFNIYMCSFAQLVSRSRLRSYQ